MNCYRSISYLSRKPLIGILENGISTLLFLSSDKFLFSSPYAFTRENKRHEKHSFFFIVRFFNYIKKKKVSNIFTRLVVSTDRRLLKSEQ